MQPRITANEREPEKGSLRTDQPGKQACNDSHTASQLGTSVLVFFRFAFIRVNPRLNFSNWRTIQTCFQFDRKETRDAFDRNGFVLWLSG